MKKIIAFLLVFIVTFCGFGISASAYKTQGFEVKSEAAVLLSLDTGDILYSKNIDQKRYPASITKIMTAIVLMDNCKDLDDTVTVTKAELDSLLGSELTLGGLVADEVVSLRVCLNLLMVCSAADAAVVIVDYIEAQTGKDFITLMNDKAKELGMKNTNFVNPTGLHDDNHYTTIRDLIKMCKYAIEQPNFLEICSQATYTVPKTNKHGERIAVTTNYLINPVTTMYYSYVRGIKTGFTTPAGRCVASTASKDGYNYLCIVMGGDDATRTEFSDSKNLYKWAFENFEYRTVANTDAMIDEMDVELSGETDFIQLYPEKNVTVIMPKDIENDSIIYDVVLKENSVWAPVEKGQILGYVSIKCAGEEIAKVNLVCNEKIERSTWLFTLEIIKSILTSKVFIIILVAFILLVIAIIILAAINRNNRRKRLKRVRKIRKI